MLWVGNGWYRFILPPWQTACFCFPCGNKTPGFPRFLSGFVSIPPPNIGAPQEIGLKISVDHCLVGAITEISIEIEVFVKTHGDPVQLFDICLFSTLPADPTCDAPRKKETETKYTGEWLEKRRTKPMCFVSRNQKRLGRHFYCFLETKHTKNQDLLPIFPFSRVSTSTLCMTGCYRRKR